MDDDQQKRVREELKTVGVGSIGLRTPESKEIARILHPNEHIGGVIYGRIDGGLAWMIATDQRVIFINKKLLFKSLDEFTYDVVSGVKLSHAGLFTSVILHSRIADFSMTYVPPKCARIFVQFIEKRRLESGKYDQATGKYTQLENGKYDLPIYPHNQEEVQQPIFQSENTAALKFLKEHDLGVLSTIDRTGNVHGAVVYYLVDQNNLVYILTKSGTNKGRNVYAHGQVALTVYVLESMQTAQLQGIAEVETNQIAKDKVFAEIVKQRSYNGETRLPPVTKLHEGSFMVIRITPTQISFHDYAKME